MAASLASKTKTKKKHFVAQKVKLFRASDPLLSVLMWGVNHSINELSHVQIPIMLMPDDFKAYSKIKNSLTRSAPLVSEAQGRSGARFHTSYDKRYVIKTISSEDVAEMHNILKKYHQFIVECHGTTLLPQFLGMYRITVDGDETYMIVTRNVFSHRLSVYKKYDLKPFRGGLAGVFWIIVLLQNPSSLQPEVTNLPIYQSGKGYKAISKALGLLRTTVRAIIYKWRKHGTVENLPRSGRPTKITPRGQRQLIKGGHKIPTTTSKELQASLASVKAKELPTYKDNDFINDGQKIYIDEENKKIFLEKLRKDVEFLALLKLMDYSLLVGIHDVERAEQEEVESEDNEGDDEGESDGGIVGTPPDSPSNTLDSTKPLSPGDFDPTIDVYAIKSHDNSPRKEVYFMAVIDILQHYDAKKKAAHAAKTVKHGAGAEISTVNPEQYSKRFYDFITTILP
ncbi:hypothetical protein QTP70_013472 [Hemibagrus guttatus]|uniref:Phosphatidylinositol 5-phosphate 4-kinase type-2 alpha n=1 Tax=Hemibagrus guttatus TaxID=175788 RepID=A0AAE0Q7J0_9TELE|nr:hypothetical protein QTP70_013472 [Hemibagrus guttatus]